jgi:hypothetical protein
MNRPLVAVLQPKKKNEAAVYSKQAIVLKPTKGGTET